MKIEIKKIGNILIPGMFRKDYSTDTKYTIIDSRSIDSSDKILKEIKKGNFIIVDENTPEKKIKKLYEYLKKMGSELLDKDTMDEVSRRDGGSGRKKALEYFQQKKLSQLLLICEKDNILSFKEKVSVKHLYGFCGTDYYEDGFFEYDELTEKYLVSYKFYHELSELLKNPTRIELLNLDLYTGINVLPPKSTDTSEIFYDAMKKSNNNISKILDMGTGSGHLAVMANKLFENAEIFVTDIIPEALTTARLNFENITGIPTLYDKEKRMLINDNFRIYRSGSMYEKVIDDNFDLILFNAPWILAKARNRSELALNDENQEVVKEFLKESRSHLSENGKIILGYSNNSGDEAVESLEVLIDEFKYKIVEKLSVRIQSYQSGRKWMRIFCYILEI
ncbi:MAG: class I SAM-dependent methyltransferase [Candidatus Delongbacteria bacterium]|nr:class I SAM-dependent methyltransferase [Candidatus Delongbacteria bacterium]MBN2834264.1 class I SAM-dependent methyltransferase [Candidatus Delongbacteria bacterium]